MTVCRPEAFGIGWRRSGQIWLRQGRPLSGRRGRTDESSEEQTEWQARIEKLVARLTADVPADVAERSAEQQARWILAHTLDWHRREEKTVWWEYFRLSGLSSEDLFDERAAFSGLAFIGKVGGTAKAPVHRYRFPAQETELRGGEDLCRTGGEKIGDGRRAFRWMSGSSTSRNACDSAELHPDAVFAHEVIGTRSAGRVAAADGGLGGRYGLVGEGDYAAARGLLLQAAAAAGGRALAIAGETMLAAGDPHRAQSCGGRVAHSGASRDGEDSCRVRA